MAGRLSHHSAPRCRPTLLRCAPYFPYKAIPHTVEFCACGTQAEYEKYAKMPIIPSWFTPEGAGIRFHADHRARHSFIPTADQP